MATARIKNRNVVNVITRASSVAVVAGRGRGWALVPLGGRLETSRIAPSPSRFRPVDRRECGRWSSQPIPSRADPKSALAARCAEISER